MQSTARQLDSSTARTDLDRPRQLLDAQAHAVSLDGLDSYSTATRQLLDRLDKQGLADSPSTAARRLLGRSAVETEPLGQERRTDGHGCAPGLNQGSGRQAGPQCVGSRSVNGASGPARRYTTPPALLLPLGSARKAGRIQTFSTVSVAHRTSPRRPEPTRYHRRSELS